MKSTLTFSYVDSCLTTSADDENVLDSTILKGLGSKNSKVQAASDRFVDLFKRVARRKGEDEEKP